MQTLLSTHQGAGFAGALAEVEEFPVLAVSQVIQRLGQLLAHLAAALVPAYTVARTVATVLRRQWMLPVHTDERQRHARNLSLQACTAGCPALNGSRRPHA